MERTQTSTQWNIEAKHKFSTWIFMSSLPAVGFATLSVKLNVLVAPIVLSALHCVLFL